MQGGVILFTVEFSCRKFQIKSAWSSILGLYQETSPSDPMLVIRIYVLTIVACCKSQLLRVALFIKKALFLSVLQLMTSFFML